MPIYTQTLDKFLWIVSYIIIIIIIIIIITTINVVYLKDTKQGLNFRMGFEPKILKFCSKESRGRWT